MKRSEFKNLVKDAIKEELAKNPNLAKKFNTKPAKVAAKNKQTVRKGK